MLTLVLGGTRSGKSEHAESVAAALPGSVTYIATASVGSDDPQFAERVAKHRARRPAEWRTVEAGEGLAEALATAEGTVLVDSLGTWVAGHRDFLVDVDALVRALQARRGDTVVVSEEVGLSVHPPTDVGRAFADAIGSLNQAVAAVADDVLLVVAGRALPLP